MVFEVVLDVCRCEGGGWVDWGCGVGVWGGLLLRLVVVVGWWGGVGAACSGVSDRER